MSENPTNAETPTRVAQTFKWPSGPCSVNIGGDFDLENIPNWSQMPLVWTEDTCCFQKTFYLDAPREFSFKFIVDGNWVCHQDMETRIDSSGNVNNFLFLESPPQKEIPEKISIQKEGKMEAEKSEEEPIIIERHIKETNDQVSESQASSPSPSPEADVISSPSETELSEPRDLTPLVSPISNSVYNEMVIDGHGGDCDHSSIKTSNNDSRDSDFSSTKEPIEFVASQKNASNTDADVSVEPSVVPSEVLISQEPALEKDLGDVATMDNIHPLEPDSYDSSPCTNQNNTNENNLDILTSGVVPCKSDASLLEITTEDSVQKEPSEELNDEGSEISNKTEPSTNSSFEVEKSLDSDISKIEDAEHNETTVGACSETIDQASPQAAQLVSESSKSELDTEHQAYLDEPLSEPSRHSYGLGLLSDASLEHPKISSESILSADSDCTCESEALESSSVTSVPRSISALSTPKIEAKPTPSKCDEGVCLDDSTSTSPRLDDEGLAESSCISARALSPKVAPMARTLTRKQAAVKEVTEMEPRGATSNGVVLQAQSEAKTSVPAKSQSSAVQKEPRHTVLFVLALKYFFFGFIALSSILIKMSASSLACKASYVFYKLTGKEPKVSQCKTGPVSLYALNFLEILLGASLVATGIVVGLVVSAVKPRPCTQ